MVMNAMIRRSVLLLKEHLMLHVLTRLGGEELAIDAGRARGRRHESVVSLELKEIGRPRGLWSRHRRA